MGIWNWFVATLHAYPELAPFLALAFWPASDAPGCSTARPAAGASAAGPRPEALVRRLRSTSPNAFVVGVGEVAGADASVGAAALDGLRDAMRDLLHESGDHQHA